MRIGMKRSVSTAAALMTASAALVMIGGESVGNAFPTYFDAWRNRYPTSTIPDRLELSIGGCSTCHSPITYGTEATAYRLAIRAQLRNGLTINQALAAVETLDSDGDGIPNLEEILRPRTDLPGEIGYHAGLVGTRGFDPLLSLTEPVSDQPETPLPACAGDANNDRVVNFADLSLVLAAFGLNRPGLPADVNRDDRVNFQDLSIVLSRFGTSCP